MSDQPMPWEKAGMNAAWYDNQPFDVGMRVKITDSAWRIKAGSETGRVVGFDATGPLPGEDFIRVLVQPDGSTPTIIAIPPKVLNADESTELRGIAQTLFVGAEQSLRTEQFELFLQWLTGAACQDMIASPDIRRQRVRIGTIFIPGLVLPELVALAQERCGV